MSLEAATAKLLPLEKQRETARLEVLSELGAISMSLQCYLYRGRDLTGACSLWNSRSKLWGTNRWQWSGSGGDGHPHPSSVSMSKVLSTEAEARLVAAVVGTGSRSPFGKAAWKEVMDHMAWKLARADRGLEMIVCEDGDLLLQGPEGDSCRAVLRKADMVVIANVLGKPALASVRILIDETSHVGTVVAFDSHPDLMANCRLGGLLVPVGATAAAVPFNSRCKTIAAVEKLRAVTEIWQRVSSDSILLTLQLLIHTYVTPVKSLQRLQATGLKPLVCMMRHCGPQLLACLMDPQARKALIALQECDPADQFCSYKCIEEADSPVLAAFTLCALQQHNCLGLSAKLPTSTHQAVRPLRSFRGQPMTNFLSENLLIGWIQELGWSWKIVGSLLAIGSLFSCQRQCFYRAKGCMWYDPVFRGCSQDGKPLWRRRHYTVKPADRPGSFLFSVLDNGVKTKELWTIVHVADDMSWGLFYYVGAAERAGQTFIGAVVVTPDGEWLNHRESDHLNLVLEKCGIKAWEIVRIDHSLGLCEEPPARLGPPVNVPPQECLVL